MRQIFLALIWIYQKAISPLLPGACRFHPSCSEYSRQAFLYYPWYKAIGFSTYRILRCNPFSKGFDDPLPLPNKIQKS